MNEKNLIKPLLVVIIVFATLFINDKVKAADMYVDSNSVFNSDANGFMVSDLQNAGIINGINGTYETNNVTGKMIAGTTDDERADFTTDLYIRSNSGKKYDKYGSSSALLSAGSTSRHGVMNIADFNVHGDLFGADAPIDSEIVLNDFFEYNSVNPGDTIDFTATNKTVRTAAGNYRLVSKGNGTYALSLKSFNPMVFRGQMTTLAQYQNQLAVNDMLFNHSMLVNGFKGNDFLTSNPNLYASSDDLYAPYRYSNKNGGLWFKSYGAYDELKLTDMNVDNYSYGALIGADFGMKKLKRGWQFMPTAFMGYNGAVQEWNTVKANQNGGQLGFLGTWYKKGFMLGLLTYGGFYGNEMDTPRGKDNTLSYFLGASTKTAYNLRFARHFSLQPNLMLSYNHFGKQNWSSAYGQMDMETGMLNGFNVAPGLNFIWEKETFNVFASLQYVFNINDGVDGSAGNISLPEQKMSSGYLQYGTGLNKRFFSDRLSVYGQTFVRYFGKTGLGVQLGISYKLGKPTIQKNVKKSVKKSKKQKTKKEKTKKKVSDKQTV